MKKNTMRKKLIISVSVVMLLVAMVAITAFAEAETGVTLTEGSVSGGTFVVNSFGSIELTGRQQKTTVPVQWRITGITDARGTGEGWAMSLNLSHLRLYDTVAGAYVTGAGAKELPEGSITVDTLMGLGVGEADLTSSPASELFTYDIAGMPLDTGIDIPLLTADLGEGMGSYDAFWNVYLTIPANAYAGTYKADAKTIMTIAGP